VTKRVKKGELPDVEKWSKYEVGSWLAQVGFFHSSLKYPHVKKDIIKVSVLFRKIFDLSQLAFLAFAYTPFI